MAKESMGDMISRLRKEQGMTQKDLAEKMSVTDKAVSKWERDLSCPDINSLPTLAETLAVSVEDLLQCSKREQAQENKAEKVLDIVLKAVPLAMGVAVAVTALLGELETNSGFMMLGLAAACLAVKQFKE